jgi:two-component system phosphate regulon sensor histidine kinase PhoR
MNEKILVVDDELGMREGCRKVLLSEGYEVETAEDGAAGLELFNRERDFAAAIVDIRMPRMDGIELIRRIHDIDEDAILLIITAYSTIDSAVEATKRGAYGYIPKPFTPDELLLPVRNGLEKRALTLNAKQLNEEREKRLLEIARERSKCNSIIRCMSDGVLVVNSEGQIVLNNAAAARIMPECTFLDLPSPLDRLRCVQLRTLIDETLRSDTGPHITSREIQLGSRSFLVNVSPVFESHGAVSGVVVVLRDITELKKLESAKSMFVSMVAHEIKGPLAAVESYLSLILNGLVKGDAGSERSMMARSLVRIQTLRKMVMELMNITAMETGNFSIRRLPQDLREIVLRAVEGCREKAVEKGVTLQVEETGWDGRERVFADGDALLIVFTNLIDNAIKYTPKDGRACVGFDRNGSYARITVTDTGIGMTTDEMEKAFDEFFRAKNKYTENVPGTGLGLSLVKRLVELHQGTVGVVSEPSQGSCFTVNLPLEG